jgi:glyoxylase-like metal-dependent hydrolase (beta-lactamase superfamily II)
MSKLCYPFPEPPVFGKTLEVMPGVHWLRMPLPMSLDHINLYLVDAGDGWYIIDTGIKTDAVRQHWLNIFDNSLEGRPVLGILATHMHPDHIGQAGWLEQHWQVPLYMTMGEYYTGRVFCSGPGETMPRLAEQFYRRAGFDSDAIERIREGARGFSRVIEPMPGAYIRIQDQQVLNWGGRSLKVVVGRGHSPEHACLLDEANGLLFSGDQIIASITSNVSVMAIEPEANPLQLWLESHLSMLSLPEDLLVLPAHGLPFKGVRTRLRQLIAHHEDHLEALEEACLQARTALSLLPVLFKRQLNGHETMLALGECVAHLHLLLARNRLERLLIDGIYHYQTLDPLVADRVGRVQHSLDDDPVLV